MADDNNKVLIEIVLDDGSIQRGFAKFEDAAKKASDNAGKSVKTIGDILNTDVFGEFKKTLLAIPVSFAAVGIAAVALGATIKEAFDLTLEGERIKAVEAQFENMAHQSGIAGEALKKGLSDSANGLIATTELLKTATGAMIELGASASKLPQILEITRNATIALGGSLEERFKAVVQAIETGTTRMLRSQGIIIDQEKAFKKYADTLGVTAGSLDKAQQQQAILNAFIDQAGTKFGNVSKGLNENNIAVKQISVSIQEMRESFALLVEQTLGPSFASAVKSAASALKELTTLKTEKTALQQASIDAADMAARIITLTAEIDRLKQKSEGTGTGFWENLLGDKASIDATIAAQTDNLNKLKEQFSKVATTSVVDITAVFGQYASDQVNAINTTVSSMVKLNEQQIKELRQRSDEIKALQLQTLTDQIAMEEALLVNHQGNIDSKGLMDQIAADKYQQLEDQRIAALEASDLKYYGDSEVLALQRAKAREKIDEDYTIKKITLGQKLAQIERQQNQASLQGYSTFFGGLASLMSSSSRELFEIGKVGAISKATIDGYLAIQNALADVPYPANYAAAAGIAIATAGNIASILGTNFGGGGSVAFSGGGGTASGPSDVTDITKPSQVERAPNQGLIVNVNGDILGDEESGRRLVSLMNAAFDSSGVTLRQGISA